METLWIRGVPGRTLLGCCGRCFGVLELDVLLWVASSGSADLVLFWILLVFTLVVQSVNNLLTWRWPSTAETCRYRRTNKLRYLDSCVLTDLPTRKTYICFRILCVSFQLQLYELLKLLLLGSVYLKFRSSDFKYESLARAATTATTATASASRLSATTCHGTASWWLSSAATNYWEWINPYPPYGARTAATSNLTRAGTANT